MSSDRFFFFPLKDSLLLSGISMQSESTFLTNSTVIAVTATKDFEITLGNQYSFYT